MPRGDKCNAGCLERTLYRSSEGAKDATAGTDAGLAVWKGCCTEQPDTTRPPEPQRAASRCPQQLAGMHSSLVLPPEARPKWHPLRPLPGDPLAGTVASPPRHRQPLHSPPLPPAPAEYRASAGGGVSGLPTLQAGVFPRSPPSLPAPASCDLWGSLPAAEGGSRGDGGSCWLCSPLPALPKPAQAGLPPRPKQLMLPAQPAAEQSRAPPAQPSPTVHRAGGDAASYPSCSSPCGSWPWRRAGGGGCTAWLQLCV